MAEWLGLVFAALAGVFGYVVAQDRRITRLEERANSLGHQLAALPKRKTD